MKWMLLVLFAFFGDFAIAQSPSNYQPSSNANSVSANVIQSKSQLVEILKTNLKDAHLLQKLLKDTRRFDDYSATYSHGVLPMLSEVQSLIYRAGDDVFDAIRPVYGWCATAKDLLDAWLSVYQQNNDQSVTMCNDIIQNLLNDDFASSLTEKFEQLSNDLNSASGATTSILTQFDSDFNDQNPLFESTLRNELVKYKNKRYTSDLMKNVVKSLYKFAINPELAMMELAKAPEIIENAETMLGQQQTYKPVTEFSVPNHQQNKQQQQYPQQQQQHTQQQYPQQQQQQHTQQQHPQPQYQQQHQQQHQHQQQPAVNQQLYMQYKNQILSQFQQTRTFFQNFKHELDKTISRVNEVKSKVLEINQPGETLQMNENTEAQQNKIKNAVKALKTKCSYFNATPL